MALSSTLRHLVVRALARTGYRRLFLFELAIDEELPDLGGHLPSVAVTELDEGSLETYLVFRADTPATVVSRRRMVGGRCFLVWDAGGLAHSLWVAPGGTWVDYLGCNAHFGADSVYVYDAYTRTGARGRDLARARSAVMHPRLRSEGVRRIYALVLPENRPGTRLVLKTGYRAVARVGTVSLGGRPRVRTRRLGS